MKFNEAFDILKAKYGDTAALTYSAGICPGGREYATVSAHGGGECANCESYEGALADLERKLAGGTENSPENVSAENIEDF